MDIKTLEYMRDRVNKAQSLVNKIGELKRRLELIKGIQVINFSEGGSSKFSIDSRCANEPASERRIIDKIKYATVQVITEEIATLEKELAEI